MDKLRIGRKQNEDLNAPVGKNLESETQ
jgi:hypothetical protein